MLVIMLKAFLEDAQIFWWWACYNIFCKVILNNTHAPLQNQPLLRSFDHVCSGGRKGYSLNEKVKKMCLERFQWAPAEMKSGPFSSQSGKECVASSPAAGSQSSHLAWQCYRASISHMDKSSFGVTPVGMAKVSLSHGDFSSPKWWFS